jgi:hypothetical protein
MMVTAMDGKVYIIGINTVKRKKYEKYSISIGSSIGNQRQQYLGW